MSEPIVRARRLHRVVPTVHRFRVRDGELGGLESEGYAVVRDGRVVLIDPVPVDGAALARLGHVDAIVLTTARHQRAAWDLRRALGAHVFAPDGAQGLHELPDGRYTGGDALPGRLVAVAAPGPDAACHALWLDRPVSVLFVSDLLVHDGSGTPALPAAGWLEQPERARASVERLLLHLPVEVVCFGHGPPILGAGRAALERAIGASPEVAAPT